MFTTRFALTAAALLAAASTADAKPHRVVILDFDGPRELADASVAAVREALADYDVVAKKKWETARASAQRTNAGPASWEKAAKSSGVDAVIEGWVQEEGRHQMLTVIVRNAMDGTQMDQLSVKVKSNGLSSEQARQLHDGLEDRLQWIEGQSGGNPDPLPKMPLGGKPAVGSKQATKPAVEATTEDEGEETPAPKKAKKPKHKKPATEEQQTEETTEEVSAKPKEVATTEVNKDRCYDIFGDCSKNPEEVLGLKAKHVPVATPKFRFGGGGFLSSRSLQFDADNVENISQYTGVAGKGLSLSAEAYPWPLKKTDGQLSGVGFSLQVYKSVGSIVGIDTDDTTGDYTTNQNGFRAAVHWRQPLGNVVHIDSEVGYGQDNYIIEDPPEGYEVPDTAYTAVHAGVHLDLNVTDRATVGFGGRYYYVTNSGDISSTEFYGPSTVSGFSLDSNFVVPLPSNMYVKGELEYKRFTSEFSGGGVITDDEGVREGTDSNIMFHVNVGIQF